MGERGQSIRWRCPACGRQHRRTFENEAASEVFKQTLSLRRDLHELDLLCSEKLRPAPLPAGPPSLDEVICAWLLRRQRLVRPNTWRIEAAALDRLRDWCESQNVTVGRVWSEGDRRGLRAELWTVAHLSLELFEAGYQWMAQPANGWHGRAPQAGTLRRVVKVWMHLWWWASTESEWAEQVPRYRRAQLPKVPKTQTRAWTFPDFDSMLEALRRPPAPHMRRWVFRLALVSRYTGSTRHELLHARWEDLDLDEAAYTIPAANTKGFYRGRRVPLHPALVEALRAWGPAEGGWMLEAPAPARGEGAYNPLTPILSAAWTAAGVPEALWRNHTLHGTRACLSTWLVRQRVHRDVIDAILGHAPTTTGGRHYTDRDALWPEMAQALCTIPPFTGATL